MKERLSRMVPTGRPAPWLADPSPKPRPWNWGGAPAPATPELPAWTGGGTVHLHVNCPQAGPGGCPPGWGGLAAPPWGYYAYGAPPLLGPALVPTLPGLWPLPPLSLGGVPVYGGLGQAPPGYPYSCRDVV